MFLVTPVVTGGNSKFILIMFPWLLQMTDDIIEIALSIVLHLYDIKYVSSTSFLLKPDELHVGAITGSTPSVKNKVEFNGNLNVYTFLKA